MYYLIFVVHDLKVEMQGFSLVLGIQEESAHWTAKRTPRRHYGNQAAHSLNYYPFPRPDIKQITMMMSPG